MEEGKGQVHYRQNGIVPQEQVQLAEPETFQQKEAQQEAEEPPREWYPDNQLEPTPDDSHPPLPAAGRLVSLL